MHELLSPSRLDQSEAFITDFQGMTDAKITYADLVVIREQLIETINNVLNEEDKKFLISVKKGIPDWGYLQLPGVENLPAVRWKLMNISKMDKQKAKMHLSKLESVLFL